jgi:hypothetical protein
MCFFHHLNTKLDDEFYSGFQQEFAYFGCTFFRLIKNTYIYHEMKNNRDNVKHDHLTAVIWAVLV